MAEEEAKEGEEGEGGGGGKKKLIIIIVAVVLLLGGGAGAFLMMSGGDPAEGEGTEEFVEEEKVYETYELDTFIVNLSENASFLKVRMIIEYDPALVEGGEGGSGGGHGYGGSGAGGGGAPAGPPGVLGTKDAMIRDAIIAVLSSKKPEEVLTPEGKEELKEELIDAINEATGLDEGPIVNIYFVEFIVQ